MNSQTEQVGKTLDNCQPKPKTFFTCTRRLALVELPKYFFELVFVDSNACIDHANDSIAIPRVALQAHAAFICIADRIRHEILDDLSEKVGVAVDDRRA